MSASKILILGVWPAWCQSADGGASFLQMDDGQGHQKRNSVLQFVNDAWSHCKLLFRTDDKSSQNVSASRGDLSTKEGTIFDFHDMFLPTEKWFCERKHSCLAFSIAL